MDAQAIKEVERLVLASKQVYSHPRDPSGLFFVKDGGGYERWDLPAEAVQMRVYTINSLVQLLKREGYASDQQYILVSDDRVVGVSEFGQVRDLYTLLLPKHPIYKFVDLHRIGKTYKQSALVTLLRASLKGAVNEGLAKRFRVLSSEQKVVMESRKEHAKGGLSQQSYAQVKAEDGLDVPDQFTVQTVVYDTAEMRAFSQDVVVLVEAEVEGGEWKFELTSVHNDIAWAVEQAQEDLLELVRAAAEGIPVYQASL